MGSNAIIIFGIGAFDSNAIQTGKSYAKTHHWTSPNKAIIDGASFIRSHYFDQDKFPCIK